MHKLMLSNNIANDDSLKNDKYDSANNEYNGKNFSLPLRGHKHNNEQNNSNKFNNGFSKN